MHSVEEDAGLIYCIGSQSKWASLLQYYACRDLLDINKLKYFGECIKAEVLNLKRVLFLDISINNISFCIKEIFHEISFFHNFIIIKENTPLEVIQDLENQYLCCGDYGNLKELNIIKLVFDIFNKRKILSSKPVHIQLEHTTYCNARCIMCDHYIAHNRGSKHLSLKTVKKLESLYPYVSMIIMHGNGEPLLNPDILEILSLYKKYHIKVSLNTNLSFVTDDVLLVIRDSCTSIHVSCDGVNKKQYEYIRQGLSYDTFKLNMKRLNSVCTETDKVLEVVLMRQNIRDAGKFVSFAFENGFSKVIFNALGCNRWINNMEDDLREYMHTAVHYCRVAKEEGTRLGIDVVTPFEAFFDKTIVCKDNLLIDSPHFEIEPSEVLHRKFSWYTNTIAFELLNHHDIDTLNKESCGSFKGICEYPFAKTYIDLNGNVSFCCPSSRKIIDSISENNNFEDIWNNQIYQKMRETFYSGNMTCLCDKCYFLKNNSLKFLSEK